MRNEWNHIHDSTSWDSIINMSWWPPGHITTVHIWEGTLEGDSKDPVLCRRKHPTAGPVTPPGESISRGNIDHIFVLQGLNLSLATHNCDLRFQVSQTRCTFAALPAAPFVLSTVTGSSRAPPAGHSTPSLHWSQKLPDATRNLCHRPPEPWTSNPEDPVSNPLFQMHVFKISVLSCHVNSILRVSNIYDSSSLKPSESWGSWTELVGGTAGNGILSPWPQNLGSWPPWAPGCQRPSSSWDVRDFERGAGCW